MNKLMRFPNGFRFVSFAGAKERGPTEEGRRSRTEHEHGKSRAGPLAR